MGWPVEEGQVARRFARRRSSARPWRSAARAADRLPGFPSEDPSHGWSRPTPAVGAPRASSSLSPCPVVLLAQPIEG